VADLVVFGLPEDDLMQYRQRIRSVTRDAALEAGRRHIRRDELVLVVVGDAAQVRGPLEALDFGPIEVVSTG